MENEKRLTPVAELTNIEEENKISGYAIRFNEPSKDLGGFKEIITRSAFDGVNLDDVFLLAGHDFKQPLARTKSGTLKLEVREEGLYFEATLPETSYAKDVLTNIKAQNVDSMSFGFVVPDGGDQFVKRDGVVTRMVNKIKNLFEISVVTIPAYEGTAVNTRSFEQWKQENTQKGENKKMVETTLLDNAEKTEVRSFEDYIRSQGEVREGLTTVNASVVVPQEVIGEVFNLKRNQHALAQYATVKQVSNGQGKYPVATNNTATLATKVELAEIADIEADMFTQVEYAVETRAGKIALSNEVVEDSVVDIVAEVKAQLEKMVDNTDNANIIALLKTFTGVSATTLDDLKKVNNVTLDPALNKLVILNQSVYNVLDTMKDNDDRYILQPDVTAVSGKSLFGNPVIVVSDSLLPNPSAGSYPIIMGDIAQSIFVARRNQVTTQWEKFDYYSQGLAVIVRNDYEIIDEEASRFITFTPAV